MKTKEVCERTGLSRKTIRLYLEKGLIVPESELRNGRSYRIWSEEDVHQLEMIASLRRAWFTMDEIQRMQQDPTAIQEIIPQYIDWLTAQRKTLEGLLEAAQSLDISQIVSVDELCNQLSEEAGKLPLPLADVQPHFKHLDEMESELRPKVPPSRFHADDRPVVYSSRTIAQFKGLGYKTALDDIKSDLSDTTSRNIVSEGPVGPLPIRILKGIAIAVIILMLLEFLSVSRWLSEISVDPTELPFYLTCGAATLIAGNIHLWQTKRVTPGLVFYLLILIFMLIAIIICMI